MLTGIYLVNEVYYKSQFLVSFVNKNVKIMEGEALSIFPSCRVKELNGNSKTGGAAKAQEPMSGSSDEVSLHKMSLNFIY